MIELKVEECCHKCAQFEPKVTRGSNFGDGLFVYDCQTEITCLHEDICTFRKNYLKKEAE